MKINDLVAHESALKELAQIKLSNAQTAWNIAEALEEAEKHLDRFRVKRDALVKQFGEPMEGNPEQFTIKDLKGFNVEYEKLNQVDVKVVFPKITIDQLNGAIVSPGDMLSWRKLKIIAKK